MHGLMEDPIVLEATLCSSWPTSVPIYGEGSISSNGGLRLGNVLPFTPVLCDILVSVGGSFQGPVLNYNHVSMGGPSSTIVGLILVPLPDVPNVQQVYNVSPCGVFPPPSIVVSSGGLIMEHLSLGDPSQSIERLF
ncbi:hypothetical protein LWI28_015892 [Acer negundo]|uniref:Uncharacterized protein n=1 Tax=Acer negundo TaxID=4023 RepID=A0AAD5ILV7_ACENE|nr:hypothetical protein LWI28_015892 [Acer negundo]